MSLFSESLMEDSSNFDVSCGGESVSMTPYQYLMMLKSKLQPLNVSFDGDNTSVASMKQGSESPLSSWDSEPENDTPSVIKSDSDGSFEDINLEENYVNMEEQNQFVGMENTDDLSWEIDNRSYENLLKKFMEKEEEVRVTNLKLQLLEEENIKLKVQVESSEGRLDDLCEELKLKDKELHKQKELSEEEIFKLKIQIEKSENQLDNVSEELKLKEKELNEQKELLAEEIFNLKSQFERSEYQLVNVQEALNLKEKELQKQTVNICKITDLVKQCEVANENLKISEDEIEILTKELRSKSHNTHQLQSQLKAAQGNIAKLELELDSRKKGMHSLGELVRMHKKEEQKLMSEMHNWQTKFSSEKGKLNFNIASLSNMKIQLTSKLEDCESRNKELENKLRQYEAEKLKQEELHDTQQMILQDEVNSLREELGQKMDTIETVNKKLGVVTIERDDLDAKIDNLKEKICSRDARILKKREYIHETNASFRTLVVEYESALNEVDKLKLRVEELEKEVTRQNDVISDAAEEKREAIRQLSCSLEHYKSQYNELLQAFNDLQALLAVLH